MPKRGYQLVRVISEAYFSFPFFEQHLLIRDEQVLVVLCDLSSDPLLIFNVFGSKRYFLQAQNKKDEQQNDHDISVKGMLQKSVTFTSLGVYLENVDQEEKQ